ncbi:MAG: threonine/serine dehydratase [Alphaproteobacteria bacterium]|jgi:threonine dehydratase|nr:pyridoxal-5'-phosphate-dependent protein [Rhodospirillaceae bacterium]MDP6021671.1 threonine/serine dehydratase [Alphaproteobacteria bacterium]MDP6254657.1 threonine/serine dehydratase [Alphaproteobacteria bacterium]MDP7055320.1 threonine/serine dehydratase [Alphaproteobacteria bacterium]MDP7229077.1 threonine/serine dehydratase [Alphaproteobacteria bacterium]|tara:strand:- start:726 stop:1718 length:993 start_codon:yes stop_codon:yes gene_type:complete
MDKPNIDLPVSYDDVAAAAQVLHGIAVRTPLLENRTLNEGVGGRLFFKPEPLQITGSFKFRGAYNHISRLDTATRRAGVIAYSSGNHGQGVAAAAHYCDAPALIVMPEDAPVVKKQGTAAWGAEIVTYDRWGAQTREAIAAQLSEEHGLAIVRPYDDRLIMAGQGTLGLEIVEQLAECGLVPDRVLVPCGGGGLTAGVATAVKHHCPEAEIHTVEPMGFDDTARSLASQSRQSNPAGVNSFCDALLAPEPGQITFQVNQWLCSSGLVVSDEDVAVAMATAFGQLKLAVEPGGATALAAALAGKLDLSKGNTVIVLSGGNVDPAQFAGILG